ncbi:MAG TPA: HEAT repeat domain-containing protein, partial [Saprospiraceae bacterium]|nr:HEAT repeat domain-containing protein [Saprospiraceae bacterium]
LTPEVDNIILGYLSDPSPARRRKALEQVDLGSYPMFKSKVLELAKTDKEPSVRSTALDILAENPKPEYENAILANINDEVAYSVLASALTAYNKLDKEKAAPYVSKYEKENNSMVTSAIAEIYKFNNDPRALTLMEGKLESTDGFESFGVFGNYTELLLESDKATIVNGFNTIEKLAQSSEFSQWKRFAVAKSLFDIAGAAKSNPSFSDQESSDMVKRSNTIVQGYIDKASNDRMKEAMSNLLIK